MNRRPRAIHDLHFIGSRLQQPALGEGDGGPGVLPDERVFAQRDGHDLEREAVGDWAATSSKLPPLMPKTVSMSSSVVISTSHNCINSVIQRPASAVLHSLAR